jgi:hypothetical protein
MNHAMVNEP